MRSAQHDDWEPQHFLGMPVRRGQWRLAPQDTQQRVMGIPTAWFRLRPVDLRWLRQPLRWSRWRLEVHRQGPYAPDFDEMTSGRR